jgi:aconitate hydratase
MAFDIEMIKQVYNRLPERVDFARKLTGKPLTAT